MNRVALLNGVVIAVAMLCAGCGRQDKDIKDAKAVRASYLKEETHRARIKEFEKRLAEKDEELARAHEELKSLRKAGRINAAAPAGAAAPARAEKTAAGTKPVRSAKAEPEERASAAAETPPGDPAAAALAFARYYESSLDVASRAQFRKDLDALMSLLEKPRQDTPILERRDDAIREIRDKIAAATNEFEKARIEKRIKEIEDASEEDLPGILDYYRKIDSRDALNRMMVDYNISRDELLEYGIEPPPRSRMRPDPKEMAASLQTFVEDYSALIDPAQRGQYQSEFDNLINTLSRRLSDQEVLAGREQMVKSLQDRYASAQGEDKDRIQRRIERLNTADTARLRQQLQQEQLRDIGALAKKYNIPANELRGAGVLYPGGQRGR